MSERPPSRLLATSLRWLLLAAIHAYRLLLGPFLGGACRFDPSCSAYAEQAILRHGAIRGAWLAGARVLRCHPLQPGGFDPVPGGKRGGDGA